METMAWWGGFSKYVPVAVRRAKGATVEDVDGNIYIDCFGGAGVMAVGHAHPDVLKAAHDQIDLVTHALDIPTQARKDMVEILVRALPKGLSSWNVTKWPLLFVDIHKIKKDLNNL